MYERIKPRNDSMQEECGVFGIYMNDDAYDPAEAAYLGLYALQHRGQESAGIAVAKEGEILQYKGMGLCAEVFRDSLSKIAGGKLAMEIGVGESVERHEMVGHDASAAIYSAMLA